MFLDFASIGRKRKKGKKTTTTKIKLEKESGARSPLLQHNILGAWKQQGVVTK